MNRRQLITDPQPNYQAYERPERISFFEAFKLYLRDADKFRLLGVLRAFTLFFAGYAPFAALNDALAPFALGIPLVDDLEIPIGIIAALKIYHDVRKYQKNP